MNLILEHLALILIAAAIGQLLVAGINMQLDRLLHWDRDLASLPPLLQEVFTVHKWFISIILVIFGALTIRFASDLAGATSEMARWLAAGIGIFWAIRTVIQWCFYGWDHWKGKPKETAIHWILTLSYGGAAAAYLFAAFQ